MMARGAVEVVATVERLDARRIERRREDSDGFRRTEISYSYHADVAYADTGGTRHVADVGISKAEYESWQTGQTMALRYAMEDPSVVEREAGQLASSGSFGQLMMGFGVLGAVMTVVIALFISRRKPNVI
jgi:hypothetical protein